MSSISTLARAGFVFMLLPLVAACATSGPTFEAAHTVEAPVPQGEARIYIYRPGNFMGFAIQPAIKLDGMKIGEAIPGGYFYIDKTPGTYEISATTEAKEAVDITVKAGETRYVRFDISMGLLVGHVAPTLIWPDEGAAEISKLHYIGGAH